MTGKKNMIRMVLIGLVVLLVSLHSAFAADKIFLVTNQKALDLAKDFIVTLNNESIPMQIVSDQYDKAKKEQYIIVLGGAKGPGSVEDFIKQVLTPQELESANKPDGKMYVKENVFVKDAGQVIIVFDGPDEAAAAKARKNNRNTWWELLVEWFDLDTSAPMAY
jgi:hypothetical protein